MVSSVLYSYLKDELRIQAKLINQLLISCFSPSTYLINNIDTISKIN